MSASPDGYTLLSVVTAGNAINATLYEKLSFNFIRDIAPVAGIARVFNVLAVYPVGSGDDSSGVHYLRQGQPGHA